MAIQLSAKKGLLLVPFLFALILFFSKYATAQDQSDLEAIAYSKNWQKLLRYETTVFTPWSNHSAISSKDFFLSESGNKDSLIELKATISELNKSFEGLKDHNTHALCRFPARYRFLSKHSLVTAKDKDFINCTNYQKWSDNGNVESISIYFATGYFGNPASFFGHPLFKFNNKTSTSEFVDASLNYGAMTPENENPIVYVLKGLLGGYRASFTRIDFFYHNHNYSETEMRNLWEYRLNLKPEEVQEIVDRTWELLGKNHPYYFLVDNCAYRMAELLEDIFNKPLLFRNRLYVMPIDLFDNLEKGRRENGEPMVSSIKIVPSRYTKLSKMYFSLEENERKLLRPIIKDPTLTSSNEFNSLNSESRAKIIETLIGYYTFRKLKDKDNNADLEARRLHMIKERFKIKAKSGFNNLTYDDENPPHDSVNSFGVNLAQGYSDSNGSFQELTLRPALYDELNPSIARPENTSLEVFKTNFRFDDSKIKLRSLEIFRVSTIDSTRIDLPETKNLSWKVRLGLKSQSLTCADYLVGFAEGGVGYSASIWRGSYLYALLKGGIQNNRNNQGTLAALPEIGGFFNFSDNWKMGASYEYEMFLNGLESSFDVWNLETRFGSSQSWDLRLNYKKREDDQYLASIWMYF